MTEDLMNEWVDKVLAPYVREHSDTKICLVLDSFSVHLRQSIRDRLQSLEVEVVYIPGGLTAELQPLDVGVNGPFKHYLRDAAIEVQNSNDLTASEKTTRIVQQHFKGMGEHRF